jgi:hypothetical protein
VFDLGEQPEIAAQPAAVATREAERDRTRFAAPIAVAP